uniref:Uncharacterized protein n=1 Tax=Panthera tigris altaica TaxID=74533 RepID=A0A8C9KJT3_PANTA
SLNLRKGPRSGQFPQTMIWCLCILLRACSALSSSFRSTSRKHRLENSPPWFCLNWLPFCSTRWIQLLKWGNLRGAFSGSLEK